MVSWRISMPRKPETTTDEKMLLANLNIYVLRGPSFPSCSVSILSKF
jgi:hypothetical protein